MPGEDPACDTSGGSPARRRGALLRILPGLLAALVPIVAAGDDIDVDRGDIYLRGGRLPSGAWGCGFAILANHRTRDDPHIEWDINVEQVNNGARIVTAVSAASFTVTHRTRIVRPLDGQLSFAIEHDVSPIRLVAADPVQPDGTFHAELAGDDATRLLGAVGAGAAVTIMLGMQDGAVESLRFHLTRDTAVPSPGPFASLCRPAPATGANFTGEYRGFGVLVRAD